MAKNNEKIICESNFEIINQAENYFNKLDDEFISKVKELMEERPFTITIQSKGAVFDEHGNAEITPQTVKIDFQ